MTTYGATRSTPPANPEDHVFGIRAEPASGLVDPATNGVQVYVRDFNGIAMPVEVPVGTTLRGAIAMAFAMPAFADGTFLGFVDSNLSPAQCVTLADATRWTTDSPLEPRYKPRPHTTRVLRHEYKIAFYIVAWFILSLVALWTNRFIVADLKVDSNVLSLFQLGMSVACGLASEVYIGGWPLCLAGLRAMLRDGLKDIALLGGVRILTVLLSLTALKYIAVSFSQTIKSSAPFFTVVLTYFMLGERTGWRVNLSLLPIITGLVFCSLADMSFHPIGFVASLLSNCTDCIQNVLTKKLLSRSYSVSQLQLYTSIVAVGMQLAYLGVAWMTNPRYVFVGAAKHNERSALYLFVLLAYAGLCFFLQSVVAYELMNLVSPVTHSVVNCVKRAGLITASIYRYGDVITPLNWSGMALVVFGVYAFNVAMRIERSADALKVLAAPVERASAGIEATTTIATLSEIVITPVDPHKQT
ncbi:hypothetical protein P43SY_005840 [Pythium insidiosum]|uniref:Sugar phosphate transporter domain-containing protein n=1 Tax=Pythium insidiosum TaxID=114742 RepID=A0AAD5QFE7_PYTIN|nr:hypothetical protein P43SY_005840 [Pythium insidiosum]